MTSEWIEGQWYYSQGLQKVGKAIEITTLWNSPSVRLWLPESDSIVRLPADDLIKVSTKSRIHSAHYLQYVAAAGRVADALTHDV